MLPQNIYVQKTKEVFSVSGNYGGGFALIVVLFILLIIVGAAWM
ncbi:sporulation protein YjcZ [Virgibacillus profundi]|uniref:Sporulation protein YjcZ n=1 Tax=Virgibacillus profundi TaxID=2024555 RepID=A0A2A2IC06_9BACI|nr:sporulation protein YjcZ [Virgibacillus profundi]PXY53711.1 YjcZ family sporulation protein [Virgibacillus profundi]